MAEYRLSKEAETDLLEIAIYTLENFGVAQSLKYRDLLEAHFQNLVRNPLQFQAIDHIREAYRRSVCGAHAIYYRVQKDYVEIMRILSRQNPDFL